MTTLVENRNTINNENVFRQRDNELGRVDQAIVIAQELRDKEKAKVESRNTGLNETVTVTDFSKLSLSEILRIALHHRSELLDAQVRDKAQDIADKNEKLKEFNKVIQEVRTYTKGDTSEMSPKLIAFMEVNNVPMPNEDLDYKFSEEEWSLVLENLQNSTSNLTNTSQQQLIELQSMMDKFNEVVKLQTSTQSAFHGMNDSIISNIR